MDTEFPGIVVRGLGNFATSGAFHYATLRQNVNLLKLIQASWSPSHLPSSHSLSLPHPHPPPHPSSQLGLTFLDARGNLPLHRGERTVWQFNFREFRLHSDVYAHESIDLLQQSGIDFGVMTRGGCCVRRFAELLITSGVVLNERVSWLTFHSGYDFGYLVKVLTGGDLPPDEDAFFRLLSALFPRVYDIKYLMKFRDALHGGLSRMAEILGVERIGPQHQAGSDSLLTGYVFLKLLTTHFRGLEDVERHAGVLFGLGSDGGNEHEGG